MNLGFLMKIGRKVLVKVMFVQKIGDDGERWLYWKVHRDFVRMHEWEKGNGFGK